MIGMFTLSIEKQIIRNVNENRIQISEIQTKHAQTDGRTHKRTRFSSVKQIRVVGTLSQLHQNVEKSCLISVSSTVDRVDIFHENFCVPEMKW